MVAAAAVVVAVAAAAVIVAVSAFAVFTVVAALIFLIFHLISIEICCL